LYTYIKYICERRTIVEWRVGLAARSKPIHQQALGSVGCANRDLASGFNRAQLMAIKVAIVEDNVTVRDGIRYLVNTSSGFECVRFWASAEKALEEVMEVKPDVVLMDIGLPGMSGIECISLVKQMLPACQILMLTVFEDDERVFQSLAAGATGYLLKNTHPGKIMAAIEDVHRGGSPMSSQIARRVVATFQQPVVSDPKVGTLSPREKEILEYLAKGYLYKEIAAALDISVDTVRTHIRNLYEKLHVRTRMEAVNKAMPKRTMPAFLIPVSPPASGAHPTH
jgi:DNA-binding NarL/FixJ family response regulator